MKYFHRTFNRNLVRKFLEAYPTYSEKDWEQIYAKELSYIDSEEVKTIVLASLEFFTDEYHKVAAASSTGKYHPTSDLGDGGLIRHTKTVVKFLVDSIGKHQHAGKNTATDKANDDFDVDYNPIFDHRDEMIAAAILHDMAKYPNGFDFEKEAEIERQWKEDPEKYFRKPVMIKYSPKPEGRIYKVPVGGWDAYKDEKGVPSFKYVRGWLKCDTDHIPVGGWESVVDEKGEQCTKCVKPSVDPMCTANDHSKIMADWVKTLQITLPLYNIGDTIDNIATFIECHMGKWNKSGKSEWMKPADVSNDILKQCANLVSDADYVASRGYHDIAFTKEGELATNRDEYLQAKKDSLIDDNKEEIADVKADIEDLEKKIASSEAKGNTSPNALRDLERNKKMLARNKAYLKTLMGESVKLQLRRLRRFF